MKRFFKKIVCYILIAAMVLELSPTMEVKATSAAKALPTLTGNQAVDAANIAYKQIGYYSGSSDDNIYAVDLGGTNRAAWCAYFVTWCATKAGINRSADWPSGFGKATTMFKWFKNKGRWHRKNGTYWTYTSNGETFSDDSAVDSAYIPKVGDVVFLETMGGYGDGMDHVGIVYSVANGKVTTVEGNTSDDITKKTDVVAEHTYSLSDPRIWGYGNPNYKDNSDQHQFRSAMDCPVSGGTGTVSSTTFHVAGWAIDKKGVSRVTYSINGGSETNCNRALRTDVSGAFPGYPTGNEGWNYNIPAAQLNDGNNTVTFYAYCGGGTKHTIGSATIKKPSGLAPNGYSISLSKFEIYDTDKIRVTIKSSGGKANKYILHVQNDATGVLSSAEIPNGSEFVILSGHPAGTYTFYAEVQNDYGSFKGSTTNGSVKVTKKTMTWSAPSYPAEDFWAYIVNEKTGLALTADANGNVCGRKLVNSNGQLWHIIRKSGEDYYNIYSKATGKNLAVYNSGNYCGANLVVETGAEKDAHRWYFQTSGNGYVIRSRMGESGVVDLDSAYTAIEGANGQLYTYNAGVTQIFKLVMQYPLQSISLNKTSATINKGNTQTLTVSYSPSNTTDSKTVTWSSSNTSVATVSSSGVVTAKAPGTATITAKVGSKTATCAVTVKAPLTSISLNKTSLALANGKTGTLSVTYNPSDTTDSKTVTWSSSNTSVATVSSAGVVTAKGPGTAIITAKVGSKTATCTVSVTVALTSISLSSSTVTLVEDATKTLTVTYYPSNTTDSKTVTWSSSNTSVATVNSSGVVTAKGAGTATITAKVGSKTATCKVTVTKKFRSGITAPASTALNTGTLSVSGYALHPAGISKVTYSVNGGTEKQLTLSADSTIAAKYPGYPTGKEKWSGSISYTQLTEGTAVPITFYAYTGSSEKITIGTKYVTFTNPIEKPVLSFQSGTLKWTACKNAESYKLVFQNTSTGESWTRTTTSLSYVPDLVAGTYKVCLKAVSNSKNCENTSSWISITLTQQKVAVTKVTLNYSSKTITDKETVSLKATITPSNATVKTLQFTSSDPQVATVNSNGVVTAQKPGNVVITATAQDGSGKKATCNVRVVSNDLWIESIPAQKWTGKAIKPQIQVYHGHDLLVQGKDYTVSYRNNKNARDAAAGSYAPTVIVKGKGNYTGKESATFTITPVSMSSVVTDARIILPYTGKTVSIKPVLKYGKTTLRMGKDYQLYYASTGAGVYMEPGVYSVYAQGIGNFTGSKEIKVEITAKTLISKMTFGKVPVQIYTGKAIKPYISVKNKNTYLREGVDYQVTYENNTKVGTATATITGIGSYSGLKKVTFKIKGESMSKVSVSGIQNAVYTGNAITQNYSLYHKETGTELKQGTDYQVTYKNNIKAGTAKVVFSGINGYSGSITKSFTIKAYDIKADTDGKVTVVNTQPTIKYEKNGSKPKVTVYFPNKNTKLVEGKDYIVSYKNNNQIAGAAVKNAPTVIITGKGNFKGTVKQTFSIQAQDISKLRIEVPDVAYQSKAGKYKSTPKIYDSNGKLLTAGKDYSTKYVYQYTNGKSIPGYAAPSAGTQIKVTVYGKGTYTGQISCIYKIAPLSIKKAKVTVAKQYYTGKEIRPTVNDLTVKIDKKVLSSSDYEIIGYEKNVNKGTGYLYLKGKGNYAGTLKVKFSIKAKAFRWWWR